MTHAGYIFHDSAASAELARLRMLESVFDHKSRTLLLSNGELRGLQCLEVGAGAGSIAAWMSSQVGPDGGGVMAIDTNTRFLSGLGPGVRVLEGEVGALTVPAEFFDVAHARYVLIHNTNAEAIIDAMLRALKPGGLLVLEEPDFSAAQAFVGPPHLRHAFENVTLAIQKTFSNRGMDYAFGRALPRLLTDRVSSLFALDYDCDAQRGGSDLAEVMRLSALTLQPAYIATGCATEADIAQYAEFAATPSCWAIYYATVRIVARKPVR
jgi:ubiquinone/menaquinone biosynthesis C-methylase UbiE